MEMRFAHLADYAATDAASKLTIVGIFDLLWDQLNARPIPFPPCYLVGSFAASVSEGSDHNLRIEFADADEKPVMDPVETKLSFRPFGPGYPLRAQFSLGFAPGALKVPDLGDYHFRFIIDGDEVGRVAVSVAKRDPAA